MIPIMGGIQRRIRTGDFFFSFVASHAPPSVATICTVPKGMLKRIVVNELKPNDFTINGPKVDIPPLGILLHLS